MKHWEDLALETAERFGGNLPHPTTSQAIANVHAQAPHAVERAIDRVALEYEAGGIRSPWGILKTRVQQITLERTTTSKANDHDKTIERAEQWIRNAGLMYDRQSEVEDELWGDRGMLRAHDDAGSRKRLLDLWDELKPLGAQVEQDADERGLRHQAQRARLITKPPPAPEPGNLEIRDGITTTA